MGEVQTSQDGTVTRSAEYVGSFPVEDRCLDEQIEHLNRQLKALKTCKVRRVVSLKFSIKGVKMYDEDEAKVLMAHALRRVSFSTARPSDSQFAFVSHNPGSANAQLYCHLFKARHARAAQVMNLLLCRCFQLLYIEKHPEEASEDSVGPLPRRNPSLLNHGFPLSVSALVSFRRAPFRGLFPGAKSRSKTREKKPGSPEEVFTASPSLVRKKAIRSKGLRSGAYRSFTFTPLKQRHMHRHLTTLQGGLTVQSPLSRVRQWMRRRERPVSTEESSQHQLGPNRRSLGSSSLVLGRNRSGLQLGSAGGGRSGLLPPLPPPQEAQVWLPPHPPSLWPRHLPHRKQPQRHVPPGEMPA